MTDAAELEKSATIESLKQRHYGTSLWEANYDAEHDGEEFDEAKGQNGEDGGQPGPGEAPLSEADDEGPLIRISVAKDEKLYIRVRDDHLEHAIYITHFDARPDGTPGSVEASGAVKVGDYLVAVDSLDMRGRDIKGIVGSIRAAEGPTVELTFQRGAQSARRRRGHKGILLTESHRVIILKHLLTCEKIHEERLRFLSSRGIPDSEKNLRPLIWRVLLTYLPLDRTQWDAHLEAQRGLYGQFLRDLTVERPTHLCTSDHAIPSESNTPTETSMDAGAPSGGEGAGVTPPAKEKVTDDPLNTAPTSQWARWFKDSQLYDEIERDVTRTHPDQQFYLDTVHGPARYEALLRILFIYAKLNPGVRYVQGMNEVAGTIYFVLATDPDHVWADHAEGDTFFCFTALMGELRDLYIQNLDETETGVEGKINMLSRLLERHDAELSRHFDSLKLDARYFSLRWITTLLSREFNLADCIRLWDSLFADRERSNFVLYFCVAMLVEQRADLLAGDFASALALLQNYPSTDVQKLLDRMYALREYDLRSESESGNDSMKGLQRLLRSMQENLTMEDFEGLGLNMIDPESLRLPKLQLSEEQRQRLSAAGTAVKTSLSHAANNAADSVKRLWETGAPGVERLRSFSKSFSEKAAWLGPGVGTARDGGGAGSGAQSCPSSPEKDGRRVVCELRSDV